MREEHYKMKFPNFYKDHGIPPKSYRDDSVKDLIKSVIDYIIFSGGTARQTRRPAVAKKVKQQKRNSSFHILAGYRSREINIKIILDEPAADERPAGNAGVLYCEIKNMDEFIAWWQENVIDRDAIHVKNGELFQYQNANQVKSIFKS